MSARDINIILGLWAASLAVHGDDPPFSNVSHMYKTIDSTPLGDVPWEFVSLQYGGAQPEDNIPPWMKEGYNVWFRDPRALVHNILSNPDFESGFDYTPFQERTVDGVHRFCDFMSTNWAWKQGVSSRYRLLFKLMLIVFRTLLPRNLRRMARSFAPSFLVVIKPLYLSLQDIMNTGQCISLLEIYTMLLSSTSQWRCAPWFPRYSQKCVLCLAMIQWRSKVLHDCTENV